MFRTSLAGLNRRQLRLWLLLFFLALAIPAAILVRQAYSQLKWEAFHQHRLLAGELAARIDKRFQHMIGQEEARSFGDYRFLVVTGDPAAGFVQRSPLSAFPPDSGLPGLIGYFQVDTRGEFSTPLLPQAGSNPAEYGINHTELAQRQDQAGVIRRILNSNRLVRSRDSDAAALASGADDRTQAPARGDEPARETVAGSSLSRLRSLVDSGSSYETEISGQAAFDRLNQAPAPGATLQKSESQGKLGRIEDLQLEERFRVAPVERKAQAPAAPASAPAVKRARKESGALPETRPPSADTVSEADMPGKGAIRVRTFESEIDPFEFSLLDSGHLVLFRKVWRDGQRYIQGALIEQQPFFDAMVESAFRETTLPGMSDLIVAWQGAVLSAFSDRSGPGYTVDAGQLSGTLLLRTRLSAPLSDLELLFSIRQLPAGPGAVLINWLAAIMALVLCAGFLLMYRLGARQIDLARQQQDFVSAVSHELKTPLTSIRMYGEMLREGWASEDKKAGYYDFIFEESERLSRLIGNVLQLARMTRNGLDVELKPLAVAQLVDSLRSKVSSQIERAGFTLDMDCDANALQATLAVDADYFAQILINLVDNALKFSARSERRHIEIACRLQRDGMIRFSVRDFGPGIARDQMKKIFRLFYRSENELTRETVGTGIGLALVRQLAGAMHGRVDVANRDPGAEFSIVFPVATAA